MAPGTAGARAKVAERVRARARARVLALGWEKALQVAEATAVGSRKALYEKMYV